MIRYNSLKRDVHNRKVLEGVEGGGVGGEGAGGGRFDEHKVSKPKPWMEMVWPFEKKHSEVVILGTESTQPVTGYAE